MNMGFVRGGLSRFPFSFSSGALGINAPEGLEGARVPSSDQPVIRARPID